MYDIAQFEAQNFKGFKYVIPSSSLPIKYVQNFEDAFKFKKQHVLIVVETLNFKPTLLKKWVSGKRHALLCIALKPLLTARKQTLAQTLYNYRRALYLLHKFTVPYCLATFLAKDKALSAFEIMMLGQLLNLNEGQVKVALTRVEENESARGRIRTCAAPSGTTPSR